MPKSPLPVPSHRLPSVLGGVALFLGGLSSNWAAAWQDPAWDTVGDRIVLQLADPTADHGAVVESVRRAGLDAVRSRRLLAPGWTVVDVAPRGEDDLRTAVAELAAGPGVSFAAPALRDPALADAAAGDDLFGAPFPRLILCGVGGDSALAVEVAAELAPELEPVDLDVGGVPGAVALWSPERDGYALLATVERLAADPRLAWAEPDWIITGRGAATPPNDPLFGDQWSHENTGQLGGTVDTDLQTLEAWELTTGSPTVPVLVIDTGVDLDHPDLGVLAGSDFTGEGGGGDAVNSCDIHGTWVAGCSSAIRNNGAGTAGASPDSPVLSARALVSDNPGGGFCPGSWTTQASWTADALDWGIQQGARVTVNSNSYGFTSTLIESRYAQAKLLDGVINFASSGNGAAATVSYPSSLAEVESVGAIDRTGAKWSQSNAGPNLSLVGPGVEVVTTDVAGFSGASFDDHVTLNGTSFSTPLVAGVAALVRTANPALDPDDVALYLKATARDLGTPGFDESFGHGLPRADAAVELALGERDGLFATPGQISITTGGTQTLELIAPPAAAGDFYLLLGTASGTTPGFAIDGFAVALNQDNWTTLTLTDANQGLFGNTFATFDGQGRATATITLPGGLNPALAGLLLHHTFLRVELAPFPVVAAEPPAPAPLDPEL